MHSVNYYQFLRLYSSKYTSNSSIGLPRVQNQFISRKVQYISDSSILEEDVSTLIHFALLTKSINVGFSSKFLYMYTSFKGLISDRLPAIGTAVTYIPNKLGVWSIGTSLKRPQLEKKYTVKSPLIQSVRKLFRRSGVDFYVGQSSFIINYRFKEGLQKSLWSKENEMMIRFFGFPLRITS